MHHWNPERYARHIQSRLPSIRETVNLLQLQPGQRALDIGCGEGTVTRMLLDKGLEVTGIDRDPQQVRRACDSGVDARVMDAMAIDWQEEFDAIFSNWCFHWIDDQPALFRRLHRALKPGGQLVAEQGAKTVQQRKFYQCLDTALKNRGMNLETILPIHYVSTETLHRDLTAAGFQFQLCTLVDCIEPLPYGLCDLVESIFDPVRVAVGEDDWPAFSAELEALTALHYRDENGHWTLDYVRHRYRAIKT